MIAVQYCADIHTWALWLAATVGGTAVIAAGCCWLYMRRKWRRGIEWQREHECRYKGWKIG